MLGQSVNHGGPQRTPGPRFTPAVRKAPPISTRPTQRSSVGTTSHLPHSAASGAIVSHQIADVVARESQPSETANEEVDDAASSNPEHTATVSPKGTRQPPPPKKRPSVRATTPSGRSTPLSPRHRSSSQQYLQRSVSREKDMIIENNSFTHFPPPSTENVIFVDANDKDDDDVAVILLQDEAGGVASGGGQPMVHPKLLTPNPRLLASAQNLLQSGDTLSRSLEPCAVQEPVAVSTKEDDEAVAKSAINDQGATNGQVKQSDAPVQLLEDTNLPRFIFARVTMMGREGAACVKLPVEAPLSRILQYLDPVPLHTRTTVNGPKWLDSVRKEQNAKNAEAAGNPSRLADVSTAISPLENDSGFSPEDVLGTLWWGHRKLDPFRTPSFYAGMPTGTDLSGPVGGEQGEVHIRFRHAVEDEEERHRQHIIMLQEKGKFALLDECRNPKVFVAVMIPLDEPADVQNRFYFATSSSEVQQVEQHSKENTKTIRSPQPKPKSSLPPSLRRQQQHVHPTASGALSGASPARRQRLAKESESKPPPVMQWRKGVFMLGDQSYRIFHVPLFGHLQWLLETEEGFSGPRGNDVENGVQRAFPRCGSFFAVEEKRLHPTLLNETLRRPPGVGEYQATAASNAITQKQFVPIDAPHRTTFSDLMSSMKSRYPLRQFLGAMKQQQPSHMGADALMDPVDVSRGETLGMVLSRRRRLAYHLDPSIAPSGEEGDDYITAANGVSIPSQDIALFLCYSSRPPATYADANDDFNDAAFKEAAAVSTEPTSMAEDSRWKQYHSLAKPPVDNVDLTSNQLLLPTLRNGGFHTKPIAVDEGNISPVPLASHKLVPVEDGPHPPAAADPRWRPIAADSDDTRYLSHRAGGLAENNDASSSSDVIGLYKHYVGSGKTLRLFLLTLGLKELLSTIDEEYYHPDGSMLGDNEHALVEVVAPSVAHATPSLSAAVCASDACSLPLFERVILALANRRFPTEWAKPRLQVAMLCASLQQRLYLLGVQGIRR